MAYLPPAPLFWTQHAIDRYREHHPRAAGDDLIRAVTAGTEESAGLVASLLGRQQPRTRDCAYVRAEDSRGIFILVVIGAGVQVRTYIRLSDHQRAVVVGETATGSVAHAARRREALKLLAVDVSAKVREGKQPSMPRLVELAEGTLWLIAESAEGEG
jgi:hypothetical protein